MTELYWANDLLKGSCMYIIICVLVLGRVVLGSEIFPNSYV